MDPQQEGIHRHQANRCELGRIDAQIRLDDRCGVEAVQCHHDGVVITRLVLHVAQSFGA